MMVLKNWPLFGFVLYYTIALGHTAKVTDYSRLKKDLMTGYDPHSRPVHNESNTITVGFLLVVQHISFDDRKNVLTLFSMTRLTWIDEHLQWIPSSYGNITQMVFANHEVWQPDLCAYNNYGSDVDHFKSTRVVATNNGRLSFIPPTTYEVMCGKEVNLRKWPYDTQECLLQIGSWAFDGSEIALDLNFPENTTSYELYWSEYSFDSREWKVMDTNVSLITTHYPGYDAPFQYVHITIKLKRHSSTHTSAIVAPGMAIAVSVLASFWIRPVAVERLVLLMFLLLVNSSYLFNVYTIIPNNGDDTPLMLLYFRDSIFMIAFAIGWTIGLRYLAVFKRNSPVPYPPALRAFLDGWISQALCLDPRPNASTLTDDHSDLVNQSANPHQGDWAWLAHLLDRLVFVVYFAVYIIFVMAFL